MKIKLPNGKFIKTARGEQLSAGEMIGPLLFSNPYAYGAMEKERGLPIKGRGLLLSGLRGGIPGALLGGALGAGAGALATKGESAGKAVSSGLLGALVGGGLGAGVGASRYGLGRAFTRSRKSRKKAKK